MQYIDLGEIAHVLKAVASVHLNLSMIFVASHFLSAKVVPWMEVKPGFRDPRKVSLQ